MLIAKDDHAKWLNNLQQGSSKISIESEYYSNMVNNEFFSFSTNPNACRLFISLSNCISSELEMGRENERLIVNVNWTHDNTLFSEVRLGTSAETRFESSEGVEDVLAKFLGRVWAELTTPRHHSRIIGNKCDMRMFAILVGKHSRQHTVVYLHVNNVKILFSLFSNTWHNNTQKARYEFQNSYDMKKKKPDKKGNALLQPFIAHDLTTDRKRHVSQQSYVWFVHGKDLLSGWCWGICGSIHNLYWSRGWRVGTSPLTSVLW